MDGVIGASLIQQLIDAAGHASWSVYVGLILLVLCALVRFITHDRFSMRAGMWISASVSLIGGIAVALSAGGVWWHALLLGGLASGSSKGFWELVRNILPKRSTDRGDQ